MTHFRPKFWLKLVECLATLGDHRGSGAGWEKWSKKPIFPAPIDTPYVQIFFWKNAQKFLGVQELGSAGVYSPVVNGKRGPNWHKIRFWVEPPPNDETPPEGSPTCARSHPM